MGRRGGSPLKRREAEAIAKKLNAEVKSKTEHDIVYVRHGGALVGIYGMRRDKTAGHPHIPRQLHVSERTAVDMARWTVSKDDYFAELKAKGFI